VGIPSQHPARLYHARPTGENGIVESFNGKLRDECLNLHWFESLADVRAEIEAWREEYE
jgi:putative transposase